MPMREDEEERTYEVMFTDEAYLAYVALPSNRLFDHITADIELLQHTPYLGRVYDPAYDAKRPPFECRVLYCESYGIYYLVDEDEAIVTLLSIENHRRDPMSRFSSFEYAIESLSAEE